MTKKKATAKAGSGELIWVSPHDLHFELIYQRPFEEQRKAKVKQGMVDFDGYDPTYPILVNQNRRIIKGQHRWRAAKELNIGLVPVVVRFYSSIEEEATAYWTEECFNTKQKPIDVWHTKFIANDLLAQVIYRLESDENSLFYGKIAIRGKSTLSTKFKVTDVLLILNTVLNQTSDGSRGKTEDVLGKLVSEMEYDTIVQKSNEFLYWFVSSFGEKPQNKTMYFQESLRAATVFYLLICEKGLMDTQYPRIIKKMSSFNANQIFKESPRSGKIQLLINHFNRNRASNTRITYVS